MTTETMTRRNYFLPDPLVDEARDLAKKTDTTVSDIIRQALRAYLDAQKASKSPADHQ